MAEALELYTGRLRIGGRGGSHCGCRNQLTLSVRRCVTKV